MIALGTMGASVLLSGPAAADPPVPSDVWIQCTGFSGPSTTWPHPLTGCIARGQTTTGSGYTQRTVPGTETIFWDAPFLKGASLQLTNIANGAPADGTSCPADHPARVGVSGVISATEPGTKQYDGSSVRATICANATDFFLATGSKFTVYKK
ncbi:hypothetical protein TUM20985_58020 [Mycobacterium antarcticum]|nr:hypothetical protein TUM20985_58020 [Mycolicibacterium sp. TUM20985]GLP81516.1 hypothetical protein TUM20984_29360 [Mycolicibacterium sp. TUM20984]